MDRRQFFGACVAPFMARRPDAPDAARRIAELMAAMREDAIRFDALGAAVRRAAAWGG